MTRWRRLCLIETIAHKVRVACKPTVWLGLRLFAFFFFLSGVFPIERLPEEALGVDLGLVALVVAEKKE